MATVRQWLWVASALVIVACASEAPVAPPRALTCDLGSEPALPSGVGGCARVYGEVTLASGRKLPYGLVVA